MMMREFEEMTGIYPTATMYKAIEAAYMEFDGDKQAFCAAYKKNKDGIAEKIQRDAMQAEASEAQELANQIKSLKKDIQIQQVQITRLEEKLEREQGWKPYEDEHNVKQADYEQLASASFTEELSDWPQLEGKVGSILSLLSDEEAADMIASDFGFDRSKIVIVHDVPKYEINRSRELRKVGTYERKALYNATDWNYILFNIRGNITMGYEMYNGELRMYWG